MLIASNCITFLWYSSVLELRIFISVNISSHNPYSSTFHKVGSASDMLTSATENTLSWKSVRKSTMRNGRYHIKICEQNIYSVWNCRVILHAHRTVMGSPLYCCSTHNIFTSSSCASVNLPGYFYVQHKYFCDLSKFSILIRLQINC